MSSGYPWHLPWDAEGGARLREIPPKVSLIISLVIIAALFSFQLKANYLSIDLFSHQPFKF